MAEIATVMMCTSRTRAECYSYAIVPHIPFVLTLSRSFTKLDPMYYYVAASWVCMINFLDNRPRCELSEYVPAQNNFSWLTDMCITHEWC